jgi:hypothetical protein
MRSSASFSICSGRIVMAVDNLWITVRNRVEKACKSYRLALFLSGGSRSCQVQLGFRPSVRKNGNFSLNPGKLGAFQGNLEAKSNGRGFLAQGLIHRG